MSLLHAAGIALTIVAFIAWMVSVIFLAVLASDVEDGGGE